jgi:hypothetical protein
MRPALSRPAKIAVWVIGILVGLVVLFLLFEYVVPAILPTNF